MPRLTSRQLDVAEFAAAIPLVRMAAPEVEAASLSHFVECLARRGGAMLGVFAGDATLYGVAIYRVEETLYGRRLAVDPIVTFELNPAAPARAALVAGLEREAARLDCASLSLSLPGRVLERIGTGRVVPWLAFGMDLEAVVLRKPIAAAATGAP